MTKRTTQKKQVRKRHSPAYKSEALKLAETVGVAQAARELDLHESQFYDWRQKARLLDSQSEVEQTQATEIVRLKRQVAEKYKKYKRRILEFDKVIRGHQTAVNRCFEGVMAVIGPPEFGEIPHLGAIFRRFRVTGR